MESLRPKRAGGPKRKGRDGVGHGLSINRAWTLAGKRSWRKRHGNVSSEAVPTATARSAVSLHRLPHHVQADVGRNKSLPTMRPCQGGARVKTVIKPPVARDARVPVSWERLRCLSRAGVERLTGVRLASPLSDELANAGPRVLLSKLRTSAWPRGRS